jgi:hypothetical protein
MTDHSLVNKPKLESIAEIIKLLEGGEFPITSFPGEIQEWLLYYREVFKYPEAATAMTMLGLLSAAVGQQVKVRGACEHRTTPLNIWTVIVAARGSGKSSLLTELSRGITECEREICANFKRLTKKIEAEIDNLRARLPKYRNRASVEDNSLEAAIKIYERVKQLECLAPLKLLIGTASAESLKKTVADTPDHFTCVLSSEGDEIISVMLGKYSDSKSSDLSSWLSMKTGDYTNDTRLCRESVTVDRGLISMLLMIQKSVCKRMIQNAEFMDRGMFTRMYFIDPTFHRTKMIAVHAKPPANDIFHKRIRHFLRKRVNNSVTDLYQLEHDEDISNRFLTAVEFIECSDEARQIFIDFYNEGYEIEHCIYALSKDFPGECSRWREDAIQIAGLLACFEDKTCIDADLAMRASNIVRWCKKNFLRMACKWYIEFFDEKFERILDLMERSSSNSISIRDLKFRNGFTQDGINAICALYVDEISIEQVKPKSKKGGRPSAILRLKDTMW